MSVEEALKQGVKEGITEALKGPWAMHIDDFFNHGTMERIVKEAIKDAFKESLDRFANWEIGDAAKAAFKESLDKSMDWNGLSEAVRTGVHDAIKTKL